MIDIPLVLIIAGIGPYALLSPELGVVFCLTGLLLLVWPRLNT